MYKTGVCRAEDLCNRRTVFGRIRPLSYELLCEDTRCFEQVIGDLAPDGQVTRLTYGGRFADVDPLVNDLLVERYGLAPELQVHDWAASDCLASAEWAATLLPRLLRAKFIASDILLHLILAKRSSGDRYFLLPDQRPLQFVRPPFVIPLNRRESPCYPVNVALQWWARRQLPAVQVATRQAKESDVLEDWSVFCHPWEIKKVLLVHPEARRFAQDQPRFRVRIHSVFAQLDKPVQAIRSMNILNLSYYSSLDVARGAAVAHRSLVEGGLWVVGRTREEERDRTNSVSLLEKRGDRFAVLERIGGGSEVEPIVTEFRS